jgi:hypothetical protein
MNEIYINQGARAPYQLGLVALLSRTAAQTAFFIYIFI